MTSAVLEVKPLESAPFGVELVIDPTEPLGDAERGELRRLYREHYLIAIRGREMSAEDQVRLAGYLGPVLEDTRKQYVSNTRADGILGDRELVWHTDIMFAPNPYFGIGLYALEVVRGRTSTRFASAVRAARNLPAVLREALAGRRGIHVHRLDRDYTDAPRSAHDVLWSHPDTGDEVLFVDQYHTLRIDDVDEHESDSLLKQIREHLYGPENAYEHMWQPHDFLIWDNRAVQHARGRSEHEEVGPRTLRRVVLGTQTVEDQFAGYVSSYNSPEAVATGDAASSSAGGTDNN